MWMSTLPGLKSSSMRSWLSAMLCMSASKQENASASARSKRRSREESRCRSSSRMCLLSTLLTRPLMALGPSCLARRSQESDRSSQSRLAGYLVQARSRMTGVTPTAPPTRPMVRQYNQSCKTIRRCMMSARTSSHARQATASKIRKASVRRRVLTHSWPTARS